MTLSQQQITEIAVQAALAAVAAATGGASAPPTTAQNAAPELPDDANDEAEARRVIQENERAAREKEAELQSLVSDLLQPRHLIVFQWVAKARGVSDVGLLRQVLRTFVASETPNYREAHGQGGASTKNVETMAALRAQYE